MKPETTTVGITAYGRFTGCVARPEELVKEALNRAGFHWVNSVPGGVSVTRADKGEVETFLLLRGCTLN